ncbi:MAG TPA: hypothetical protein VK971_02450, partial [Thiohalobacter sp.]|nr:hypothetical protein [Thiohalobacter sp.]
ADTAGVRPGMAVEASIEIARREDVLVIPQQALRQRQGGAGVFVLAEGIAHWRPVRVGAVQQGRVEVLSGVQPGDELIVTPHPQLAQGRPAVARNDWRGSLQ